VLQPWQPTFEFDCITTAVHIAGFQDTLLEKPDILAQQLIY
jgi:hypothetical protein